MELKNIVDYINKRLKKHSLAHANYAPGIFVNKVVVSHPHVREFNYKIVITKEFGWWHVKKYENNDFVMEMNVKITEGQSNSDLIAILDFINNNTVHETPES